MWKFRSLKIVAVAILSFSFYVFTSIFDFVKSTDIIEPIEVVTPAPHSDEYDRIRKEKQRRREEKLRRGAVILNNLAETEDIWLRRSAVQHDALREEVSSINILED